MTPVLQQGLCPTLADRHQAGVAVTTDNPIRNRQLARLPSRRELISKDPCHPERSEGSFVTADQRSLGFASG